MPLDFPNSPSVNQTYTAGGNTWIYDGTVWRLRAKTSTAFSATTVSLDSGTNYVWIKQAGTGASSDGFDYAMFSGIKVAS